MSRKFKPALSRVVPALLVAVLPACSSAGSPSGGGSGAAGSGGSAAAAGSSGSGGSGATGGSPDAGSGGTPSGGAAGAAGAAGGGGAAGAACAPVTLGELLLADTEPGGSSLAYSLKGLDATKEHVAYIEFFDVAGPRTAGAFDLSAPPDDNYKTCAHCVLVFEDVNGPNPTPFFPSMGSMNVTTPDVSYSGASAGSLASVTLVEVTLASSVTTPVPGGRCLLLSGSWDNKSP